MTFWEELWRMFRDRELTPSCRVPSHNGGHCEGCRCNVPWISPQPMVDADTGNTTTPEWLNDLQVN